MTKIFCFLALMLCVLGCSSKGQTTFYWAQEGYGPSQFARDHAECMNQADLVPWKMPNIFAPDTLGIRPEFESGDGVWAYFVPYRGAQPIYTNYVKSDSWVRTGKYERCMHAAGYYEQYERLKTKEVGTLYCNSTECQREDEYYEEYIY